VKKSIMVVDDEAPLRDMLRNVLTGQGYAVEVADSGEQALEIMGTIPVDVVITDLKMPGMDGLELARLLLAQDSDRPVLLMTAYGELESARKAIHLGVYEYFTKPFSLDDVLGAVKRAIERRELTLAVQEYQQDLERRVAARTEALVWKVRELEARDRLLCHLLSVQHPDETLSLALELALGLSGCDVGILYLPEANGKTAPRIAIGFEKDAPPILAAALDSLRLHDAPDTVQAFEKVLQTSGPVTVGQSCPVRQKLRLHTCTMFTVKKDKQTIAVLEIGQKQPDAAIAEQNLNALKGFLPYIAMAVVDCRVEEELPEWQKSIDAVLKTAEKWNASQV